MAETRELGPLLYIDAEALGEPGKRTFRLLVGTAGTLGHLWMEKAQLQALAVAIDQLNAQLPISEKDSIEEVELPSGPPPGIPRHVTLEFQVGRLALGYDEESDMLVILIHNVETDQEGDPTLSALITRPQARLLSERVVQLSSAGRPRCPLCGTPVGPNEKHVCPGSNGHFKDTAS